MEPAKNRPDDAPPTMRWPLEIPVAAMEPTEEGPDDHPILLHFDRKRNAAMEPAGDRPDDLRCCPIRFV
jgi:hypothetical protein